MIVKNRTVEGGQKFWDHVDDIAKNFQPPSFAPAAQCPKCGGEIVSSKGHGMYCPKPTCKWGWEVEMDGSPLQPPKEGGASDFYKQKYGYAPQRGEVLSVEAAMRFADEYADQKVREDRERGAAAWVKACKDLEELRQERDALSARGKPND